MNDVIKIVNVSGAITDDQDQSIFLIKQDEISINGGKSLFYFCFFCDHRKYRCYTNFSNGAVSLKTYTFTKFPSVWSNQASNKGHNNNKNNFQHYGQHGTIFKNNTLI